MSEAPAVAAVIEASAAGVTEEEKAELDAADRKITQLNLEIDSLLVQLENATKDWLFVQCPGTGSRHCGCFVTESSMLTCTRCQIFRCRACVQPWKLLASDAPRDLCANCQGHVRSEWHLENDPW